MGWIVFVLLVAAGAVAYYYLTEMEKEIRAELAAGEPEPGPATGQDSGTSSGHVSETDGSVESRICLFVRDSPGVLQTELYKHFPELDKKLIQKTLLDLDRSGKISRTKSGSTYKIT